MISVVPTPQRQVLGLQDRVLHMNLPPVTSCTVPVM